MPRCRSCVDQIAEVSPAGARVGAALSGCRHRSVLEQRIAGGHVVVFDYDPRIDEAPGESRGCPQAVTRRGVPVVVSTLDEASNSRRSFRPNRSSTTGGSDERLGGDDPLTNVRAVPGQNRSGAMVHTERMLGRLFTGTDFCD